MQVTQVAMLQNYPQMVQKKCWKYGVFPGCVYNKTMFFTACFRRKNGNSGVLPVKSTGFLHLVTWVFLWLHAARKTRARQKMALRI
jgi:hypothetical protein